jgi:hypothetical protein
LNQEKTAQLAPPSKAEQARGITLGTNQGDGLLPLMIRLSAVDWR